MDASTGVHADINKVCGYFNPMEEAQVSGPRLKNTKVKYTRLPDYNIDPKVTWHQTDSYILHPKLRRIVALEDEEMFATHSLTNEIPITMMSSTLSKRKIVTISEDEEYDRHPRFSKNSHPVKKIPQRNILHKSVETVRTTGISSTQNTARSSTKSRNTVREIKPSTLTQEVKPESLEKTEVTSANYIARSNYARNLSTGEKAPQNRRQKNPFVIQKTSTCRKKDTPSKSVDSADDKNVIENMKNTIHKSLSKLKQKPKQKKEPPSRSVEKKEEDKVFMENTKSNVNDSLSKQQYRMRTHSPSTRTKKCMKDVRGTPVQVIRVPHDGHHSKDKGTETNVPSTNIDTVENNPLTDKDTAYAEFSASINTANSESLNTCIQIKSVPKQFDSATFTDVAEIRQRNESAKVDTVSQTYFDSSEQVFYDSLDIPNVTLMSLTNDISDVTKENRVINSQSLPNLKSPAIKIISSKNEITNIDENTLCKSASFIIGRASLTYTTKQKIDFHVFRQKGEILPRVTNPLAYPLNVVSVFRKEISKHREISEGRYVDNTHKDPDQSVTERATRQDAREVKSLHRSYSNGGKLVKPSDVIRTIRLDDGLMQNDFMCEQFQRELNFIDSFFESLQYLERCSSSGQGFTERKIENWVRDSGFNVRNAEYDQYFPKIDNDACMDDNETIAAKSLYLLNLLIRDEQRRAKNLLFVLKMREDALKDFTKSQILWLENKKKQDNIDIPTLKKKQRGALLKLQHECGEMQRMRKSLLTLSEKRRVALLKTKKNIELKLNNNLNLNDVLLNKKKIIKRNTEAERNSVPLKCLNLSSSGGDESGPQVSPPPPASTASEEKGVQTGRSLSERDLVDDATDTTGDNIVCVDGSYLNILFGNLGLPLIFSAGRQYEVNEDALQNVVNSSNKRYEDDFVKKFIDQIRCPDMERSSTPSTARSLVDEFDMYYKGLVEDGNPQTDDDKPQKTVLEQCSADSGVTACGFVDSWTSASTTTVASWQSDLAAPSEVDTVSMETLLLGGMAPVTTGMQVQRGMDPAVTTGVQVQHGMDPVVTTGVQVLCIMDAAVTTGVQVQRGMDAVASTGMQVQRGMIAVVTTGVQVAPTDPRQPGALEAMNEEEMSMVQTSSARALTTPAAVEAPEASEEALSTAEESPATAAAPAPAPAPARNEAEELRRQQLAIEKEIKALEQQQSQLLAVREIPDKPPPPYTPPMEARAALPRKFAPDDTLVQRVHEHIHHPTETETTDLLDVFIKDFCQEMVQNAQGNKSDNPWDPYNLLPQKKPIDLQKLVDNTASEINDVLTVSPALMSGGSGNGYRRTDHVDEILFAEWRRREPAWTALHADEAEVKNQIFETIFQRVLFETVDEYKRTVLACNDSDTNDSQPAAADTSRKKAAV